MTELSGMHSSRCSVCKLGSDQRLEINRRLLELGPGQAIAVELGIDPKSVHRHHVWMVDRLAELTSRDQPEIVTRAQAVSDRLIVSAERDLDRYEARSDEERDVAEAMRIERYLRHPATAALARHGIATERTAVEHEGGGLVSRDHLQFYALLHRALGPWPDARAAIASALEDHLGLDFERPASDPL